MVNLGLIDLRIYWEIRKGTFGCLGESLEHDLGWSLANLSLRLASLPQLPSGLLEVELLSSALSFHYDISVLESVNHGLKLWNPCTKINCFSVKLHMSGILFQ